jgi:hypothetical protein
LHFPHDQLESCVVIFNFWGPKALQKKKERIFRHWTACENSKFTQFENHWGNLQDETTCQLGICTIGNVEFLGLGQPVKILILDV